MHYSDVILRNFLDDLYLIAHSSSPSMFIRHAPHNHKYMNAATNECHWHLHACTILCLPQEQQTSASNGEILRNGQESETQACSRLIQSEALAGKATQASIMLKSPSRPPIAAASRANCRYGNHWTLHENYSARFHAKSHHLADILLIPTQKLI
ncbi:hypothetical protein [Chromobacterium sp. IIBBL 290-4]|uniref:hypothetical protein n=1 Tax=Chromobacterium sp. IIBBL 290-4 TaxID=2953890 RepID=UPI0020B6CF89|nr:hypothetical protein [Chromobacterium sp. IIBBL 290-4]UTH73483.1 hypothetical protein NKT35_18360 [Chromobacterium sp. IIBBL 290-4]